jgi:hypothetical protein
LAERGLLWIVFSRWRRNMPIVTDLPENPSPAGMTDEADWETLLEYTGELTDEVIRSWWGTVPVSAYPAVTDRLQRLETETPDLAATIRRVTGLPA